MKKIVTLLLILLCILCCPLALLGADSDELVIVTSRTFPPLGFVDDDGELKGILIDYWKLWAERNNQSIRFYPTTWDSTLILTSQNNNYFQPGLFKTEERLEFLDYTRGLSYLKTSLFAASNLEIERTDITTQKVGATRSENSEEIVRIQFPNATCMAYDNNIQLLEAAIRGDISIFVMDEPVALYYMAKMGQLGQFKIIEPMYSGELYAAVKKGNAELLTTLNEGMEKISEEEVEKLYEKWLYPDKGLPVWLIWLLGGLLGVAIVIGIVWHIFALRIQVEKKTASLNEALRQITEQNSVLQDKNDEISKQRDQIQQAHEELKSAQAHLVQSEKMAALGQIVGNVAHEINTPAGAIDAAIKEMGQDHQQLLETVFKLVIQFDARQAQSYLEACQYIIEHAHEERSTRDQRQETRAIAKILQQNNVTNARNKAQQLAIIGFTEETIQLLMPLIASSDFDAIVSSLRQIGMSQIRVRDVNLSIGRITDLVKALKSYAHLDEGSLITTHIPHDLDTTLILLRSKLKAGVTVHKDFDDLPEITCYADELNQVWTNLIHNSIQALAGNGDIFLRAKKLDESRFFVEVEDTGTGIPDDVLPRIFEPYYSTKSKGEGTGMGLHVCKQIIKKNNGTLTVTETRPGKTVFRVTLPYEVIG